MIRFISSLRYQTSDVMGVHQSSGVMIVQSVFQMREMRDAKQGETSKKKRVGYRRRGCRRDVGADDSG